MSYLSPSPDVSMLLGDAGGYWSGLGALPLPPRLYDFDAPARGMRATLPDTWAQYEHPETYGISDIGDQGRLYLAAANRGFVPRTVEGLETVLAYLGRPDFAIQDRAWEWVAFLSRWYQPDPAIGFDATLNMWRMNATMDPRIDFPDVQRAFEAEWGQPWHAPAPPPALPPGAPPPVATFATAEGTFPLDLTYVTSYRMLSPAEFVEGRQFLQSLTFDQLFTAIARDTRLASAMVGMGIPLTGFTSGPNVLGTAEPPVEMQGLVASRVRGPTVPPTQHPWAAQQRSDPRPNYGADLNPFDVTWVRGNALWGRTFDATNQYPPAQPSPTPGAPGATPAPTVEPWYDLTALPPAGGGGALVPTPAGPVLVAPDDTGRAPGAPGVAERPGSALGRVPPLLWVGASVLGVLWLTRSRR